jgi:hypothetical protein
MNQEIIDFYRGWDQLEKGNNALGAYVIDFDLAELSQPKYFANRLDVLECLYGILSKNNFRDDSDDDVYIRAKLEASSYYLRALMGEQIAFEEYVEKTMGVKPTLFSDDEIKIIKDKIDAHFDNFNLRYEPSFLDKYNELFSLQDLTSVQSQIDSNKEKWLSRLSQYVELVDMPPLRVVYVSKDAFWHNWIQGNATDGILLQINTNPRVTFQQGEPTLLALHEIFGHAVQMSIWLNRIRQGILSSEMGIVTVHTPEMFQTEGLAQALIDWLANENELPATAVLSRWMRTHRLMVYNNAHVRLAHGEPIVEVFSYVSTQLPFASETAILGELKDRGNDPLVRTYRYIYGMSEKFFSGLNLHLAPSKKKEVLKKLYERPLLPSQIMHLVD